jgi:hypothetical protein
MVLPDADPLHEDNVRPADRNGQAIPTHQTTSPKATMTRSVGLFSDNLSSWPYLVKLRARAPQRGKWKALLSGTMRFFLPSSGQKNGVRPPNHPVSPKLAKSHNLGLSVSTFSRNVGSCTLLILLANCSTADRLRDQFLKSRGPRLGKWFLHEPIPHAHKVDGCCRQHMLETRFRLPNLPGVS